MRNIPELMTVDQFIKDYCPMGRTSLYREAAKPNSPLKLRKFGTATRIARADAEAWLASLPVINGKAA